MTEVASLLLPTDHRLTSVRHYEAGPPAGMELVEPGETFATTKEEEWVSKKKTEVTNTKQIETRVKRQVVLEDGKVVEDSGPMVTTNTTEDTETQEHHQTELRKLGNDDDVDGQKKKSLDDGNDKVALAEDKSNWVAVPNPDGVVREVKERRIISREETEEVKEMEDVQHLGDITDEDFLAAVRTGRSDLRPILRSKEGSRTLVSTGPQLVHESSKTNKVTDTEDTRELSSLRPDGKIITETERTTEHEELKDEDLPKDAPDQNHQKESSQRYLKTRTQEDVDYLADGVHIGHEMRFRTETMEAERRGDGVDEADFDSLSARVRRRTTNYSGRQPQRHRQGLENGASPLDRKDALTRRPLDFDQEEETRKVETSKWLEHHFGSDSRSSNNSTIDDEEQPPKTSFFNVTIKSQPVKTESYSPKPYVTTVNSSQRVYSPVEPERDRTTPSGYYKGISEWSERRQEHFTSTTNENHRRSPLISRTPPDNHRRSPIPDYRPQHSPIPDYRPVHSPTPDYNHSVRISPKREIVTPTPPQRKRSERQRQRVVEERTSRYDTTYRNDRIIDHDRDPRREEPPPDYSPPSPPPMPVNEKKLMQKTRFAMDQPKAKSGNIIGQSIRKLVGKIRSASAERKARQRAKRSPSPTYQAGHIIDNIDHGSNMDHHQQPVQRYYLGEDPFAGSIYGRENKYDGVKPARTSRRSNHPAEEQRSQSTLGRFSKSTSRLVNTSSTNQNDRVNSQTLPRHLSRHEPPTRLGHNRSNSTINVSIINTVSSPVGRGQIVNEGPAKPARTYRSNLARSKSLNVHADELNSKRNMYTSNPHLHRLDENPIGLKSPGLISSLDRSHKDVETVHTSRFSPRNGLGVDNDSTKRVFLSNLKERAPELFQTLHETEDVQNWKSSGYRSSRNNYTTNGGDIYEPPTRLRDTSLQMSSPRRGSNSSNDYSETYRTTTRNDDPVRPSVTNTVKSFTKKTIPSKDGKSLETIESSETKSVTKSHYRGGSSGSYGRSSPAGVKFYDSDRVYQSNSKPVVIEVRNYRK